MENVAEAGKRAMVRDLLSRAFHSGAEAAAEICERLRTELDVDLVWATHAHHETVEFVAVADRLSTGLRTGARFPIIPAFLA